ncbi:hypothetical protein GCM10010430_78940 [Kitasatospora cystarginea]|uniref:CN hydrolase domain-containing protein n=1 Tax=Kitasatospora cystarginea TaxID=58350 RepID=A0ABN3F146_9ACTN
MGRAVTRHQGDGARLAGEPQPGGDAQFAPGVSRALRLAVAQSTVPEDPGDRTAIRAAGAEVRALMREAAEAGARLVQFPEGALVYPHKRVVATGPDGTGVPADWTGAAWDVLREEAQRIAALAGELELWTVFGSLHPLTPPRRILTGRAVTTRPAPA